MIKRILPLLLLVLFIQPTLAAHKMTLFNGKNLQGWRVVKCKAIVEDGCLKTVSGNGLVSTEHRYQDFILEFQCQALKETKWDSGIYFRCELPAKKAAWPPRYQVNLLQGQEGSLAGSKTAKARKAFKPKVWNHFRLEVRGNTASLKINGKQAWKTDEIKAKTGYIGIQAEVPGGGQFKFKDIYLTELNHESIFNRKDLSGWEGAVRKSSLCWAVKDHLLVCTGKKGPWLRSKKQYGDFNLRLEYKLKAGGNSGVYVRVPKGGQHHGKGAGVEVQILDDRAKRYRKLQPYQFTGSVYAIAPSKKKVGRAAGQWNSIEIDCRGHQYIVIHNGVEIVRANTKSFPKLSVRKLKGFLGLQNHSEEVWFRNLRIGAPLQR